MGLSWGVSARLRIVSLDVDTVTYDLELDHLAMKIYESSVS